jgi:hypothetical protein
MVIGLKSEGFDNAPLPKTIPRQPKIGRKTILEALFSQEQKCFKYEGL